MIYVGRADLGGGAVVDVSVLDSGPLMGACNGIFQAVGRAHILARTGYTDHAYDYLLLWMMENRPDTGQYLHNKQERMASMWENVGTPTADELLLATRIGDGDTPTVRWKLSRDALLMIEAGMREVLIDCADDPPDWELMLIAGGSEEHFHTVHQEIKDVLASLDTE